MCHHSGQAAARTVPADGDRRPDRPEFGGMLPGICVGGRRIVDRGRERVFRREPVADRQHPDAGVRRKEPAQRVVTDQAAGHPGTAVEEHQQRRSGRQPVGRVEPAGQVGPSLGGTSISRCRDSGVDGTADQRPTDVELPTATLRSCRRCPPRGEPAEPQQQLQVGIERLTVAVNGPTGQRVPNRGRERAENQPNGHM